MIRHIAYGAALTLAILGVSPAQALERPQINIEARIVEIDIDLLESLPISRDFRSLATLAPAIGGIANSPADLAPADVSFSVPLDQVDMDMLIRALEEEGLATSLASPTVTYGSGQSGPVNLINSRLDMIVPSEDGQQSLRLNAGVTYTVEPHMGDNGVVNFDFQLTGDYAEFEGGMPGLDSIRVATTVPMLDGQTFVIAGLFDEGSREAAGKISALGDVPIIGSIFRSIDFQRGNTDLMILVTTRIASLEYDGAGDTSAPGPVGVGEVEVSGGVGYTIELMPDFAWLRTETGFQGNIVVRPLVSEDSSFSGAEWRLGVATGLSEPLLGGFAPRIGVDFSYFNADIESFTNFITADGNGLGIEDGTGSGVFIANGFGDLFDTQFQASYLAFDTKVMVTEDFDVYPKKGTSFGAGLNLRYSEFDANLMSVTNGNTTNIERADSVQTFIVAPTFTGRLSHDYTSFLTAYGGASLSRALVLPMARPGSR